MVSLPGVKKCGARTEAILFAFLISAFAVSVSQETQTTTPPASGQEMYLTYCAVCHGIDGKGGGPATPALKDQVPDLTTLARRYNGKYPADYVTSVLRFGAKGNPAHGSQDMPIWGPIFRSEGGTRSSKSRQNASIATLNRYLETLQIR